MTLLAVVATAVGVTMTQPVGASASPQPSGSPAAGHLVPMTHSVPARPHHTKDVGAYIASNLQVEVSLAPSDQQGLQKLLTGLYAPGSPQYHHWLPQGRFDADYAPGRAAVASVRKYLQERGLQVSDGSSPFLLRARGSSAKVQAAFGTHLDRMSGPHGKHWFANTSPIEIPAGLIGVVNGVVGLDSGQLTPVGLVSANLRANFGGGPGGRGLTPSQLNSLYDGGPLGSGPTAKGAGVTLALFELSGYELSGIATFAQHYDGSHQPPVHQINVDGGPGSDYSWDVEVMGDADVVLGQVPDLKALDIYNAPNSFVGMVDEYDAIARDDQAQVVSASYGYCEPAGGRSTLLAENTSFEQMAAQGQSVLVAAGDHGAYDCGSGLDVDDPASQPYVTGVGGTSLGSDNPGSDPTPAYPPAGTETAWNDGCTAGNPNNDCDAYWAGGGGVSINWARPATQQGPGVESGYSESGGFCGQAPGVACREVPDVSAIADYNTGYSVYCPATKGDNSRCDALLGWVQVGGTSLSAPLWATIIARWDAAHPGSGFGDPAPYLYRHPSLLHDISTPTTGLVSTNGFYPVTAHYDMATGLGTPDIAKIVQPATSTAVSCSPDPVVAGETTMCTATVSNTATGTVSIPSGSVGFSSDGHGSFRTGSCTLSAASTSGVMSCQVTYIPTATGSQTVTAGYSGDAIHAASSGSTMLRVTATPACTRTLSGSITGPITVASGQTYCLNNARAEDGLNVASGGALVVTGSTVDTALSADGATFVRICASTVNGPTTVQHGTNAVVIGDAGDDGTPSCAADQLNGPVTVSANVARIELGADRVSGPVTVNNNTGSDFDQPTAGPELEANRINGPLSCRGNDPLPTNDNRKNTVRGPESGQCTGL